MMLQNLAAEVKTNLAFDDKKFACLRKPFAASFDTPTENTISTSFSAATEDISFVEIQSFEANFLGKGEVFSENNNLSSNICDFSSTLSSQPNSSNQLGKYTVSQVGLVTSGIINSSNQSVHSNSLPSVLRCLADERVIANDDDLVSSKFNSVSNTKESLPEEQLVLPGFTFAQSSMVASNSSSPLNLSESSNLPDEPCGDMPTLSNECRLKQSPVSVNQVGSCLSEVHTCFHSQSLTSSSDLNSEASSGHLLEMINCLIEEAEVKKIAEKAKEEELLLLKKEVDHLKQTSHAILMYLDAMQKSGQKLQQIL